MTRLARWPAIVLTAGRATRLRPLSSVRAKAALPVAGVPLVGRILGRLSGAGVTRAVLNLHHLAATITRQVGDGSRWGLQVRYSWERDLLGSAGGPARALPLAEADRVLVVNGDTLADVDLEALVDDHLRTGALVTLAVATGDPRYNAVVADEAGRVHGFGRADEFRGPGGAGGLSPFHFVGVQAVNAAALAGVDPDVPSETVRTLYPALIARAPGSVRVFQAAGGFLDIGTPRDYLDTAIHLARIENRPLDVGRRSRVSPGARLDRTLVWDDVTIDADVALSGCIVADGVHVPAGTRLDDCSIVMTPRGMISTPLSPQDP